MLSRQPAYQLLLALAIASSGAAVSAQSTAPASTGTATTQPAPLRPPATVIQPARQPYYASGIDRIKGVTLPPLAEAPKAPLTLAQTVQYAAANYPSVLKAHAQTNAAHENITVQRLNEYMPDGLMQFQEVMASHNKLTQIIYGSPVFPANPGPGFPTVGMNPMFFSGVGFNLDWAPIDFGLHKAKIQLAKNQYGQMAAQMDVTVLDVQLAAANAFLDMVETDQQVAAAGENVNSFEQFKTIVEAQVKAQLKPGADLALAEAELANAQNQLFRARLNADVARINLANALGLSSFDISINDHGMVAATQSPLATTVPVFETVPIFRAAKASLLSTISQRQVLAKEYFPTIHFLGGIQNRGSALTTKAVLDWQNGAGLIPTVPNYQAALIVNWNFLDCFALRAEKRVQNQRIIAQQQECRMVLQNLQAEDARSKARVRIALDIAANMPVQVDSSQRASEQAQARYQVGLSSVAQVAEANQVLAQSRMQEAVANVGVWRALLSVAAAHGDIAPFVAEADHAQRGM